MPDIHSYEDMTVELMQATEYPAEIVALAQALTMGLPDDEIPPPFTHKKGLFLMQAEHESLTEHVIYTFLIQGISRSLLAQLTRQRTASPTSGSQHYQDYSDYPCAVHEMFVDSEEMQEGIAKAYTNYTIMLNNGAPREEARQVLPNAATVNFLWTIDALNLHKFLRKRLCHRNVAEMQIFSGKVLSLVRPHFPEWFDHTGPQCFSGKCYQGFLKCKKGPWVQPS